MAYNTYTQSFGLTKANSSVTITQVGTGIPAIVMATTSGGILNHRGKATLDSSGNLSVVIDTALSWNVDVNDITPPRYVPVQMRIDDNVDSVLVDPTGTPISGFPTATSLFVQSINSQSGTTYTLALTDAGLNVDMTSSSANTVTIPNFSTVPFPAGTTITITQAGAGQTTIAAAGGVSIVKPSAKSFSTSAQLETATLYNVALNTWRVYCS